LLQIIHAVSHRFFDIQAAGYPKRCLPEKVIFIYFHGDSFSFYPPSQKTTGMPVDECKKIAKLFATARCHPKDKADNRVVAEGEDGYFNGTTGLPPQSEI
jgi:hypothetical protein